MVEQNSFTSQRIQSFVCDDDHVVSRNFDVFLREEFKVDFIIKPTDEE